MAIRLLERVWLVLLLLVEDAKPLVVADGTNGSGGDGNGEGVLGTLITLAEVSGWELVIRPANIQPCRYQEGI